MKKIAIIGAGPAGIAAAVQLLRYGYDVTVFEKYKIGGLIRNANLIENLPGFPNGISGIKYAQLIEKQLMNYSFELIREEVISLKYQADNFIIHTKNRKFNFDIVLAASGTNHVEHNLPIDEHPLIKYEIEDVLNISEKRILIIGSGDAAFDYALNLSRRNAVTIFNRSDKRKCLDLLYSRAMNNESIKYSDNTYISHVLPEDKILNITYITKKENSESIAAEHFNYLIYAIGRHPNNAFIDIDEIQFDELTRKKRLFLIGDIKNGIYRQTSISIADGVRAAMEIWEIYK